jgi:hypothetical protein
MKPFGVRVHIVLPGRSPETSFGANAMPHLRGLDNPDYKPLIEGMIANFREDTGPVTHATDVAEAVWRAATDPDAPLSIPAGADAVQWMAEARRAIRRRLEERCGPPFMRGPLTPCHAAVVCSASAMRDAKAR